MQRMAGAGHAFTPQAVADMMEDLYRALVNDEAHRFAELFEHLLQADAPLRRPRGGGTPARWSGRRLTLFQNGTIMVSSLMEDAMPTTLTLKNIPDDLYLRLKASAESHRRSLNSEALVCLESVLLPGRATAEEVIARARAIRDSLPKGRFTAEDIDAFKREGRA